MFFEDLTYIFVYLWITVSCVLYFTHYVVEVILDLPITGQSPCSAHAYLKQLIQRFSGEAVELPTLTRSEDHPARPEETISDRTYEDLLSTAIINKVVQSSQNEGARSSPKSSRASANGPRSENKEYFFGEETLENKWKNQNVGGDDTSSVSSLDDWVRSDSSIGSSKYVDRVSLTIKQRIEEGTSSSDDENNGNTAQENSADESWHENWYFQKRRLNNSNSPVPVPMLVPNPITEAKVLIGDKEAEELSDIDSDYGETAEVVPDIKNILVNSKTIIGGKNAIHSVDDNFGDLNPVEVKMARLEEPQSEMIINEFPTYIIDVQNEDEANIPIIETNHENISLISIDSNTEQDTEYTEKYASLPRTILKDRTPVPRPRTERHLQQKSNIQENGSTISDQEMKNKVSQMDTSDSSDEETNQRLKIFKGSYSEREKEKWKHSSVDIPDNPYSPENLERRISSRSSNGSNSSIFGRDYYVRNAAKSAGTRKKSSHPNESEVIEYSPTLNGNEINSETPVTLVTAMPAVIQPEESTELESIESPSLLSTRPVINDISSDSDLSIERVYNLQSGKVFEKKGDISQEILSQEPLSPEGLKYVPKEFDEDVKSLQKDENHNNTNVVHSKLAFMRSLTQNEEDPVDIDVNKNKAEPEEVEEEINIVPYDDSKFKTTLEMFKSSEKSEVKNVEKVETIATTQELQKDTSEADTTEIVNETQEECKLEPEPNNFTVTNDMLKYFGEAKKIIDNKVNTSDYSEEEILSDNREFSLEYSTDINEDDLSRTTSSLEADPEIIDLKEKRLVKDLLGKFSRSFADASITPIKKVEVEQISIAPVENVEESVPLSEADVDTKETSSEASSTKEIFEEDQSLESPSEEYKILQSVKDLKQLFDKENASSTEKKNPQQIYSLTARSLPKVFRQKLKSDDEISLQNEESVADISIATEDELNETLPADITRNMIAFYEQLENKKKH